MIRLMRSDENLQEFACHEGNELIRQTILRRPIRAVPVLPMSTAWSINSAVSSAVVLANAAVNQNSPARPIAMRDGRVARLRIQSLRQIRWDGGGSEPRSRGPRARSGLRT